MTEIFNDTIRIISPLSERERLARETANAVLYRKLLTGYELVREISVTSDIDKFEWNFSWEIKRENEEQ